MKTRPLLFVLAIILIITGCSISSNLSPISRTGQVLIITDLHFTPFSDPSIFAQLDDSQAEEWEGIFRGTPLDWGTYGQGTTSWLFLSIVEQLRERAAGVDFVVFLGDVMAHHFDREFYRLYGSEDRDRLEAFILKTYRFFYLCLNQALPGKKIIFTLGNNDYYCGDYQIQPNGGFLADIGALAANNLGLDTDDRADFDLTFSKGGYYRMDFPGQPDHEIIVLNNIFFSPDYTNSCGSEPDQTPGREEIDWLRDRLQEARDQGRQVWLMQHMPLGLNIFSTVNNHMNNGQIDQVLNFWQDDFAAEVQTLLAQYSDVVTAIFSGHTHQDDIRVNTEKRLFTKIVPALSPVFDNNPGFILASYTPDDLRIFDYQTRYLDLNRYQNAAYGQEKWLLEYDYATTYGLEGVNTVSLYYMHQNIHDRADLQEKYENLYDVSNPTNDPMPDDDFFQAYWCGQSEWTADDFLNCFYGL